MSANTILLKYLPLEKQSELTQQLIADGDLQQALEIITITGIDLSTNVQLINHLFEKIINQIDGFLSQKSHSDKTIQELLSQDNEFSLLLKFISSVSALRCKLDQFALQTISNYIETNKQTIFDNEFYENFVKSLVSNISYDDTESLSPKQLNDFQLVLFLRLLETIYILDENKDNKTVSVPTDNLLIALLGCDTESIALQSSQLIRWRFFTINQYCHSSPEFSNNIWSYLTEIFKNSHTCNWKLKISLIFLLRSVSSDSLTTYLIQFIHSDDFWIGIQFALKHDIIEYRKIALSIVKKIIERLSSSDIPLMSDTFTSTYFCWDHKKKREYELSWNKYITLYEIVALDTNLEEIKKVRKDINNLFNNSLISESWGLIVYSTGLKSFMRTIKEYMVSSMLEIKNKSVFSSNLPLLRSTLLPSLMDITYFKSCRENPCSLDDNYCPHGKLISDLFYGILAASNDNDSHVLSTLLETIIDIDFIAAKIYCCDGIYKYLINSKKQILSPTHLSLITELFKTECNASIFKTTLMTYLFSMLKFVNEQESSPTQWVRCIVSHLKCCDCSANNLDKCTRHFHLFAMGEIFENQKESLHKDLGVDAMFDAVCMIYLNVRLNEYSEELQDSLLLLTQDPLVNSSNIVGWNSVNEAIEKNIINLLKPTTLEQDDMDIFYRYGSTIISRTCTLPNVNHLFDYQTFLAYTVKYFSPEKLEFLNVMCSSYSSGRLLPTDGIKQLYNVISKYCIDNTVNNVEKDKMYTNLFSFILLFSPIEEKSRDFLNEIALSFLRNINENNFCYSSCRKLVHLFDLIWCVDKSANPDLHIKYIDMISTIWNAVIDNPVTQSKTNFQFYVMSCIFSNQNLFIAYSDSKSLTRGILESYIKQICALAYNHTGFLRRLSAYFYSFMDRYKQKLTNPSGLSWLSSCLISIFVQEQSEQNIFKLTAVTTYLYDHTFPEYTKSCQNNDKTHGKSEVYSKLLIISSILESKPEFQRTCINFLVDEGHMTSHNSNEEASEEKARILKWQLQLMLLRVLSKKESLCDMKDFIKQTLQSLETENSTDVRVCKEWTIAYYFACEYIKCDYSTDLEDLLFSSLTDHSKPFLVVSAERILFLVLKAQSKSISKVLLNRFISVLVSNATSNKPLVRHFSNSLILLFWPIFKNKLQTHNMKDILENLFHNAQNGQTGEKKARAGDAKVWELFEDLTLSGIFGYVTEKINGPGHLQISAYVFHTFYNSQKFDIPLPIEQPHQVSSTTTMFNKIKEEDETLLKRVERSDLIVVASLVDKPFNLGGICRLCDVLGAKVVTMQDLKVVNHPQFKNVALSSDQWMPMEEVPIDSIAEYMQKKKVEGYTLIGLEQTDKSIRLDEKYNFPTKSLILLGTEAYGIPGPLLGELDLCLEIQQHGVIRSMNIQTATAVIVHSYTIQHL
ncbi:tRNA (guanosine(18)-2'-O)-methyltransferase [Monosporozyma unispora]